MRVLMFIICVMLFLGFVGYAQNGFSTACKPPYHTVQIGNSVGCG